MTREQPPAVDTGPTASAAVVSSGGQLATSMSPAARLAGRLLLFGLLINTTLFFRGCSMSDTHFTSGFPFPAVEYQQDMNQSVWTSGQIRVLPWPLARNLGCLALLALVTYFARPLRRWVSQPLLTAALLVTFLAFNCVLLSPTLWVNTTFLLQSELVELLLGDERRMWVMDTFSRVYFLAFVGCVLILISGGRYLWRTQVAAPNTARWQVQLVGLFVLTTLVGLLAALVNRLLFSH